MRDQFALEIDQDAVLEGAGGDFVVLTMSRAAGYDRRYVPCAAGMGENRAYLLAVSAAKLSVLRRDFGGCGRRYRVIKDGARFGYEVIGGVREDVVRYVVRGNALVREK